MKKIAFFGLPGLIFIAALLFIYQLQSQKVMGGQHTVRVGILHSLSGVMARSEQPIVDVVLMAIEEINAKGGVLGRKIVPVIADGKSDEKVFAKEAERLIVKEKVDVVFGVWTSAARKAVKPIFEKYDHLLFYPVQYEGLEVSPNIIYLGAAPNQQIIPAVKWSFDHLGKRMFLVGSDYIFPRTANEIIRLQVQALGGEIVGEHYENLQDPDYHHAVQDIVKAKPDVIISTINGDGNIGFFKALRAAGVTPQTIPVMSFSVSKDLFTPDMTGNYAAWNYFQSLNSKQNSGFIHRLKARYGQDRQASDPVQSAYSGVFLWAKSAERANSTKPHDIQVSRKNTSIPTPGGILNVDTVTNHVWKRPRIGKINKNGEFDIVWEAPQTIHPNPFPMFKSKSEWALFLEDLYQGWGQNWSAQMATK
ncbi:MAG: urea ABC transporter substrate-binding protein [Magnetovibrio sp.]|nr:urea ABC transporter substrate-binding protein [Magnetovibrio sp.]